MVISTGVFHAWKKPSRVMNECWRVLRPGGQAWIYDPAGRPSPKEGSQPERKLKISEWFALKWGLLTSRITLPYTLEQVHTMIKATKFEHYEVEQGDWLRIKLRK